MAQQKNKPSKKYMTTTIKTKKPKFTFEPKEHLYKLDGKPMTGVTTILSVIAKPSLIQWSANEAVKYIQENFSKAFTYPLDQSKFDELFKEAKVAHRKKKEAAGEAGTDVHALIEIIIKNAIKNHDGYIYALEVEHPQVKQFVQWAITNKVKFLASEKRLYSLSWWVAGTADIVCEIEGKRYIGDIKTSSGIYTEHYFQTSAYAKMAEEMGASKKKFDGVVIINCRKDGGFDYAYNYDLQGNQKAFEGALALYRQINAVK